MGKKFLLILASLFIFAGSASAYSNPRWFTLPVSVYMPKTEQSVIVTDAFKAWQVNSKSAVRFMFRNSANLAPLSNINVSFTEHLQGDRLYVVNPRFRQFGRCRSCANENFFYQTDIIIALRDADGNLLTDKQLKAVALQAAGRAVGVNFVENKNSVMYQDTDFSNTSLTQEDIKAVRDVYLPVRK